MRIATVLYWVFQTICFVRAAALSHTNVALEVRARFNATSLGLNSTGVGAQGLMRKMKSKMGMWYDYEEDSSDDDEPRHIEYHEHPKHEIYVDYKDEHYINSYTHNGAPIIDCEAAIETVPDHQVFGEGAVIQFESCCIFLSAEGPDMPGFLVKERARLILEHCTSNPDGPVSGSYDVDGTKTVCVGRNQIKCCPLDDD